MPFLVTLIFLYPLLLNAADDSAREQIQQRIRPIGEVHLENEMHEHRDAKDQNEERASGREIYEKHCVVCHQEGLAGAPKFGVAVDWVSRVERSGLDGLVATSLQGVNAMPPKGTCFTCDAADLRAAIEYMVPEL